jgi:4-hydroxy-3-polyprenylbenzoate decarboxylase
LPGELPSELSLPDGFYSPRVALPGVLVVESAQRTGEDFCAGLSAEHSVNRFPLIVVVDDSEFTSRTLNNFVWVTFTRSNPAADIAGIEAFTEQKHWGCRGALVIDARRKPHHAPPLIEDPAVTKKIDVLAARGGPLAKYL